jgi:ERCC4-type nuclease
MGDGKHNRKDAGFPAGVAAPAIRALHDAGFTSLDQLTRVTEAELMGLHGMGPKALKALREALRAAGKSFADSPTP